MEYYSDICMPPNHLVAVPYTTEYIPPEYQLVPNYEAEYAVRSSVLVDGGDRFGVSAVVFDKYEELVWMGNQGGHVTSYYGPAMQKYTSFQVHQTDEIRDIITMEQSIYILTKTQLRNQIRRGIPKKTYRSENMTDMQCLYQASHTNLLMGGHQDKLLDLDLTKMVETVIPINEEGCAVLRSGGGSLVACGSADGTVTLRDLRTPLAAAHCFRAHSACLSDLDMQGDILITAGFTHDSNSAAVAESYVVVWDVRCLRGGAGVGAGAGAGSWVIEVGAPPLLVHFLPAVSGRAAALSGSGHVALLHVHHRHMEQSVFQVETNSSICSAMDISSTSQAMVFGDQAGRMHLFSPQHNHEPVFNNFSRATEFADPPPNLPFVSLRDETFKFSSVPRAPLTSGTRWLNELPPEFYKKVYRKPKPIDPEVLKTMKMQGPIGYAPNPRTHRRNEFPYIEDTLEDLKETNDDSSYFAQPVPTYYQKMDPQYSKQPPNDIDLANMNKTGFPGLEATLPNSYCNPMLQVLYYTPPVKAALLTHTCAKEYCLTCELGMSATFLFYHISRTYGFLFRMLDTSGGAPCQATNFLRAFRTVPEAAALGLILPDGGPLPRVDLGALIQSWNSFMLHQMHYEIVETRKKEKELALLAASSPTKAARTGKSAKRNLATPVMNGVVYGHPTNLQFQVPMEFHRQVDGQLVNVRADGWQGNPPEEGMAGAQVVQNQENHELGGQNSNREESEISQLFAIGRHQLNRCLKCNKEEERESVVLACALQYPPGGGGSGAPKEEAECVGGFAELVRASLAARRSTPAWCEHCHRFTPTAQRGRVVRLPPILAINCGGVTAHEKTYWSKNTSSNSTPKEQAEGSKRGSNKPCRYGLHCARPGCRFKHPDRPGGSGNSSKTPTDEANSSNSPTHESVCSLPLQLLIRIQSGGDITITDKADLTPTDSPKPDPNKYKKKSPNQSEEYSLSACVVCIEGHPRNLVAYIQDASQHWYLFNDLCIVPVSAEEVVQFGVWWKTPCIVLYSNRDRLNQRL